MKGWLRQGLEGRNFAATIRLYLVTGSMVFPVAFVVGMFAGARVGTLTAILLGGFIVLSEYWIVYHRQAKTRIQESILKRTLDVIVALLGLLFFAPLMALVAIAIVIGSGGPVIVAHRCVGLDRRPFRGFRFRVLVSGATDAQIRTGDESQKKNEAGMTSLGRWLHRTSIDELPHLINVLKGEMSLVGPRPLSERDAQRVDTLSGERRFSVKPGLATLWEPNPAGHFEEWIRWDLEYIDNWSLRLDLKIFASAIRTTLSGVFAASVRSAQRS